MGLLGTSVPPISMTCLR